MKSSRLRACFNATVLFSLSSLSLVPCLSHAMISVSSTPNTPDSNQKDSAASTANSGVSNITTIINILPAKPLIKNNIGNEASAAKTAKLAKLVLRDSWTVPLPGDTKELCMAGVCLGDPMDFLPTKSANASGSRVKGDWLQAATMTTMTTATIDEKNMGNSFSGFSRSNRSNASQNLNAQFQMFEDMRDTVYMCSLSELVPPLAPRMRLVFFPEDGSPSGIEVVLDLLPKRRETTKSIYAVTKIQMSINQGNSDEAATWVSSISKIWPSLKPISMHETGSSSDQILAWSTNDNDPLEISRLSEPRELQAEQSGGDHQSTNSVVYKVSPYLSIGDELFNASQWDNKPVTHQLQWSHGVYGLDLVTSAQTQAVEQTLRKQRSCENAKITKSVKKEQIKELTN